jgi:hypothetical protein
MDLCYRILGFRVPGFRFPHRWLRLACSAFFLWLLQTLCQQVRFQGLKPKDQSALDPALPGQPAIIQHLQEAQNFQVIRLGFPNPQSKSITQRYLRSPW